MAVRYTGTVTTSGNSEAIRLEKSLFRAHPEFERGHEVVATVIAPGRMLVSIAEHAAVADVEDDPILDAFLGFLATDIERHPEHLQLLSAGSIARAAELTRGIDVGDDEEFPDDVSV